MAGLPIMVLTLWMCQQASTFTLGWCAQGPQELNPHSARVGTESPIRWLIPRKMKTAPEYPWGGCLLRLNASGDNRPGAQGKLTLRARLHIPVSFRAVPERHDSMIRGAHRRSNAISRIFFPASHIWSARTLAPRWQDRRRDVGAAARGRGESADLAPVPGDQAGVDAVPGQPLSASWRDGRRCAKAADQANRPARVPPVAQGPRAGKDDLGGAHRVPG